MTNVQGGWLVPLSLGVYVLRLNAKTARPEPSGLEVLRLSQITERLLREPDRP